MFLDKSKIGTHNFTVNIEDKYSIEVDFYVDSTIFNKVIRPKRDENNYDLLENEVMPFVSICFTFTVNGYEFWLDTMPFENFTDAYACADDDYINKLKDIDIKNINDFKQLINSKVLNTNKADEVIQDLIEKLSKVSD